MFYALTESGTRLTKNLRRAPKSVGRRQLKERRRVATSGGSEEVMILMASTLIIWAKTASLSPYGVVAQTSKPHAALDCQLFLRERNFYRQSSC
jgi:hypothetical protein